MQPCPPPPRLRWRRLRRTLGYGGMVLLIGVALVVAIANQMLPALQDHPKEVARWLSERVGQPVQFSAMEARWTRRGPRFALQDLEVGEGEARLAIGRADLQVAIYSGLFPGMPLTELSVDGLALTLHQDMEGRWRVLGLPKPTRPDVDPLDVLEGFGELRVQDARLSIDAERWNVRHTLPRINARVRVSGSKVHAGARLWSSMNGLPLDLVADMRRDGGAGQVWLGAERMDLDAWGPLLAGLGVEPLSGGGRLGAWARLDDRRITEVQLDAALTSLRLRRSGTALPPVEFERAGFAARWSLGASGWQVSVPRGEFAHAGKLQRIEDFWMGRGNTAQLSAERIDMAPLLALAALSNRLPQGLAAWLAEAEPEGTVTALDVQLSQSEQLSGSARVADVGFAPVGRRPGLRGLGGQVQFDSAGGALAIEAPAFALDWPSEFGPELPLTLAGQIALWRDGDSWTVGSDSFAVQAPGLGLTSRFELGLQADGTRPSLALSADLDDFDVVSAKRFWLQTTMKPPLQNWLNMALVSGHARQGHVVMAGDLDDWPFRNGKGKFDAQVLLDDVTLKFNEAWPAATAFSATARFTGPGMALEGMRAQLIDTLVSEAEGGITDFKEPWLDLKLRGGGDAEGLRRLVLQTPLYAPNRSHLDALSISGPAAVDLRLRMPLRKELGTREVEGRLSLDNATVSDRRWAVRFDGMTGGIPFTDRGFAAEALPVRYGETPGVFSLRVGDTVLSSDHVAEMQLEAELAPEQLLDRSPELAWLKPWLEGRSSWKVGVSVPRNAADAAAPPSVLSLQSNLVGTRLGLPAPLRKSAATPLPLQLSLPLPIGKGELELQLGQLMRLRGRMATNTTPFAGLAEFGSDASGTRMPARGIAVRGQVPSLDVGGWIAAASGGGAGGGGLQSVDVRVGAIDVLDRSFGEGRLELRRENTGLWVRFDGPSIAGQVNVPSADGAAIDGNFERLHWPAPDARAMTGQADAAPPAVDQTDPSRLPPLHFRIDDFRLGQARLGRADLRTFPTPEGMHIDRFSTNSEALKLDASGDWTRIGGQTRSRFALDFDAESLGGMLDALGFTGMIEQGPVKARMVGDWPGSPGSFRLDRFDGNLRLDVGKGRLLDVEPGTGRFLGLVSIAEIPRRLTLDFSDFFSKGFAFNGMSGDFEFDVGSASTSNLRIDGPSAEINVSGRTALAAREYDQRVEVLPKAGGVLPAIGAVTAGPAGAALGAVAQAVLQIPLKQVTRTVYSIEGSWAEPKVNVVERGPRRSVPAAEPVGAAERAAKPKTGSNVTR